MYGGELTGSSGQVASPNYPNQYPHNVNYVWTITVDIGLRIRVIFNSLDLESIANCYFDYVKVSYFIAVPLIPWPESYVKISQVAMNW